jgi:hypothetical protein
MLFSFPLSLVKISKAYLKISLKELVFQRILSKFHSVVISYVACALLLGYMRFRGLGML